MKNIKAECLYTITLPKLRESAENCQDACSVNLKNQHFAISDGVTKSFLPADWAKLLVEAFTNNNNESLDTLFSSQDWQTWLTPLQKQWEKKAKETVGKLTDVKSLFLRNQLAERVPAAATFIGLRKKPGGGDKWQYMIIGDSCLFHFSKRTNIVSSYLLKSFAEFNSHPGSLASYQDKSNLEPTFGEITIEAGDYVLLCTDALSKFLFYLRENDIKTFGQSTINLLDANNDIGSYIEVFRLNKDFQLEDDDVGIVALAFKEFMDGNPTPSIPHQINQADLQSSKTQSMLESKTPEPSSKDSITNHEPKQNTKLPKSNKILSLSVYVLIAILIVVLITVAIRHYNTPSVQNWILSAEDIIVLSPASPYIMIEITSDFSVTIIEEQIIDGVIWKKVEYSAWVRCSHIPNKTGLFKSDTSLLIYLSPTDQVSVGIIPQGIPVVVVDQSVVNSEIWCHTISQGYITVEK